MSINDILVHDTRLEAGFPPHGRIRVLVVNASTPLEEISRGIRNAVVSWRPTDRTMRATARRRQVPVLSVAAHGVEVSEDDRGRDTALQVGRELIHSENALEFGRAIAGVVTDRIRILNCAMAATENGRQICSDLARGARTRLFASSSIQIFNSYAPPRLFGPTTYPWCSFGRWEGTVYEFRSDGSHRVAWHGRDIPRGSPPPRGGEAEPEERFECRPDWRTGDLRHGTGS